MKRMKRQVAFVAVVLIAVFLLQACAAATAPQRVVAYPAWGQPAEQVNRDTAECEAWARQATGYTNPAEEGLKKGLTWGVIGGAIGAGIGAAIGAVVGDPGQGAALGAIVGGGAGGVSQGLGGAGDMQGRYERAYMTCMTQRGYAVSQ